MPTPRAAGKAAPRTCASRRPTTRPWHRRASGLTAPGSTSPANTDEARGRHPEVVGTSGDGSCRRIHQRLHHHRRRRRRRHRRRHHRRHRHRRINQWVTAHGRGVDRGGAAGSDVYLVAAFAAAARFRCGASCNGVWRCCVDYTSRRVVPVELVTVGTVVTPPARGAVDFATSSAARTRWSITRVLGLTLTLGARAGARVSELYGRVLLGLASRIGVHPQREIQCINAVKGGDFRTSDSISPSTTSL